MVYLILILHLFTVILDICSTPFPVFVHVFDSGSWLIDSCFLWLFTVYIYLFTVGFIDNFVVFIYHLFYNWWMILCLFNPFSA